MNITSNNNATFKSLLLAVTIALTFNYCTLADQTNDLPTTQKSPDNESAKTLPHITFDLETKTIELEATVVQREADWLELLACSPGTREHEAILTVPAKPSHIHLALTAIGLKHGSPMMVKRLEDGKLDTKPAHGPAIAVSVIYQLDDQTIEQPAGKWIINRKTDKTLDNETWIFTGSHFQQFDDQQYYMADIEGTIISLVNFGDDLLTLPSKTTNYSDQEQLGCNTAEIPPIGTPVTIRLQPVPVTDKQLDDTDTPATQPTTQPAEK